MSNIFSQSSFSGVQDLTVQLHQHGFVLDSSVDLKKLNKAITDSPQRWNTAFNYIIHTNLANAPVGTVQLIDKDCFATISEYEGKDLLKTKIESHESYSDIQMVIRGEESIGVGNISEAETVMPYNQIKDIGFYKSSKMHYHVAGQNRIFIFFPDNIHQPGLKSNSGIVKKLVIKVKNL